LARAARRQAKKAATNGAATIPETLPAAATNQVTATQGSSVATDSAQLASETSAGVVSLSCDGYPKEACQHVAGEKPTQVGSQTISLEELFLLRQTGESLKILDVRTERSFNESDAQVKGAVRLISDHVAERARELDLKPEEWLIAYCA